MPTYDSQATRRRLLAAATAEFAMHGFAGARTDRIAEAADSNKAQIYYYFTSKTGLFDAVFEQALTAMESEVPFDAADLAGYAGRLVELHERRPEIMRLCTWQRLERSDSRLNPAGVAVARAQIDAVARAQKAGDIPSDFPPAFILGYVLHLATSWVSASPEYYAAIDIPDTGARARHVENAVRQLLGQPLAPVPRPRRARSTPRASATPRPRATPPTGRR